MAANFDLIALVIGYGVMVIGGVLIVMGMFGFAMNLTWRKLQDLYGLDELIAAHRAYKADRRAAAAPPEGEES